MHVGGIIRLNIDELPLNSVNDASIDAAELRHGTDGDAPIHFVRGGESIQFQEFLHRRALDDAGIESEGERVTRIPPDGWGLSVAGNAPIAFQKLDLHYVIAD